MDIELPEPPPMQASPEDIPLDVRATCTHTNKRVRTHFVAADSSRSTG